MTDHNYIMIIHFLQNICNF